MPRIGATLAALVLIACSIAVNVSRYPVVWEMANPVSQLAPPGQSAQSEPAKDPAKSSDPVVRETALASASSGAEAAPQWDAPTPDAPAPDAPAKAAPRCTDGVCSLGSAPSGEPPHAGWDDASPGDAGQGESTYEDPYPAFGRDRAAAGPGEVLPLEPEPRPDKGPDEDPNEAPGEAASQTEGFAQHGGSAEHDDEPASLPRQSAGGDDEIASATVTTEPDEVSEASSQSPAPPYTDPGDAGPATSDGDPSAAAKQHEHALDGAEAVEPSGPYAGWGGPGDSSGQGDFSHGQAPRSGQSWPGAHAARPVVPVVPQGPDARQGYDFPQKPTAPHGDLDVRPYEGSAPPPPTGSQAGLHPGVRRLPPVDELNPFLNDGYNPPVPDISGMDYPSTGIQ